MVIPFPPPLLAEIIKNTIIIISIIIVFNKDPWLCFLLYVFELYSPFAKAINIFDQNYYVAGRLAETMFDSSGAYATGAPQEIKSLGLIPGAPRAGWIGVRYEFGGVPEAK